MATTGKKIAVFFLLAWLVGGCGTPPGQSRLFIVLLDVSGSIKPEAEADAFRAVDNLAKQMRRGDSITVIPIKSDAETETEGSIIRHTVPMAREAYDQDIRRFTTELHDSLEKLEANALAHPGGQTDILGSLDLAQQEIVSVKPSEKIILILLSDFIQEDTRLNFTRDRALAAQETARELAAKMAQEHRSSLADAKIYLGGLRSGELAGLDPERQKAIQAFWIQYFMSLGATTHFATDGPGLLGRFVLLPMPTG